MRIAGTILTWLVLAGAIFAIMTLWNWDPIAFLSDAVDRIASLFLSWEWFNRLVGA